MMTHSVRRAVVVAAAAALAVVCAGAVTTAQQAPAVKRTVLLQHDTSAPGFEAVLVAVEIPVGGREGRAHAFRDRDDSRARGRHHARL